MVDGIKNTKNYLTKLKNTIPEKIKEKYKTAFHQDQLKLIDCAAARQKWIDQGQSLNLYNNKTSLKFLNDMYMHAWKSGLKTTYYLRSTAASAVEKSTVSAQKKEYTEEEVMACSIEACSRLVANRFLCMGCIVCSVCASFCGVFSLSF